MRNATAGRRCALPGDGRVEESGDNSNAAVHMLRGVTRSIPSKEFRPLKAEFRVLAPELILQLKKLIPACDFSERHIRLIVFH